MSDPNMDEAATNLDQPGRDAPPGTPTPRTVMGTSVAPGPDEVDDDRASPDGNRDDG